ncbi:MAG: hypothetical protein H7257_09690 [Taibaiella sp.]|nr:hypothetical protein [Taibaiella sp.]
MKIIAAIAFLFLSLAGYSQDIKFKLNGPKQKKWIGQSIFNGGSEENFTNLTFYRTMKVAEENRKYNTKAKPQPWSLVSGAYLNDDNIVVNIGDRQYRTEFSQTNNGKELLTLTLMTTREEEPEIIKTY